MPHLYARRPKHGVVQQLLRSQSIDSGLEKQSVGDFALNLSANAGEWHNSINRRSDSRMLKQYKRGTMVRNTRQVSILSVEELSDVATAMVSPEIKPEWVGANVVTSGIPDLTLLPPSSRLQFPSGATIVVDIENLPCRYPAAIIEKHHPEQLCGFVKSAKHKRGIVGWVEAEGRVSQGDAILVWLPPQRGYPHT